MAVDWVKGKAYAVVGCACIGVSLFLLADRGSLNMWLIRVSYVRALCNAVHCNYRRIELKFVEDIC